jgi:hypothetical protein
MQVDCFMCSTRELSDERRYFEGLALKSLIGNGMSPKVLYKPMLQRYYEAEKQAKTDLYILCDNDIVLATPDTLPKLISIMGQHPEYSQLGLGWKSDMEAERNSSWKTNENGDIWDFDHVGGCLVIRKGIIRDLGYMTEFESGYGDDRVMGKVARELGYRVGIVPSLYFYHLGAKYSTLQHE